jgi:hypothetical protein
LTRRLGPHRELLEDLRVAARFFPRLPGFLRRQVTGAEARATVRAWLDRREADFLDLMRDLVYANPASPYRALLAHAGCESGDLERLVRTEGVEDALSALWRQGVYLSVEEFKGRRPLVRGGRTIPVDPAVLVNPGAVVHVLGHSSGSRGPKTTVPLDLAWVRDHAMARRLVLEARDALGWRHAVWGAPGGSELVIVLRFAVVGAPPEHWFSQPDPGDPELAARFRWSWRGLRWGSRLAGQSLPVPRHVPLDRPDAIVDWMAHSLRAGAVPHLKTYASAAIGLCQAASARGIDLGGARFTLTGEPLTAARQAVLEQAGIEARPDYGGIEMGQVGEACVRPAASDDLHVMDHIHAIIQPGADGPDRGLPPNALLLSSLRRTAPLVFLNVSLGDGATLERRRCGCLMEAHGWTRHLRDVRSFEKLTSAGMTFLDVDVIRILDEILPARLGGVPGQYQLVEDELPDGRPRVRLLIHPAVGPVDPALARASFLAALASGSDAHRSMAATWREAGLVEIERRPPVTETIGKILHFRTTRRSSVRP